ncbi:MAG TPA: hypothetical protein VF669_20930 [Tepidisphaeraceae bacterium]|jgi:hypothetical protein
MRSTLTLFLLTLSVGILGFVSRSDGEEFPKPSPYPKTWELKLEYSKPKRVVVQTEQDQVPKAYWYVAYTVTNSTDKEQLFLPQFEMVTKDGQVIRSDKSIPKKVFDTVKRNEGNNLLVNHALIGGQLRLGQDEAKDGVAIWPEPDPDMGNFTIFISGLSGETAKIKGPDKKDLILRKTLQINYLTRGDAQTTSGSEPVEQSHEWVMR